MIYHLSDCENPRFTERTSTNLGRSHRLPHVCTIMIYGKLGGVSLAGNCCIYILYILCDELWIICDIWVSLMWILEKYDDITLKRGIANLGKVPSLTSCFLTISINFHKPMSVEYIFSISRGFYGCSFIVGFTIGDDLPWFTIVGLELCWSLIIFVIRSAVICRVGPAAGCAAAVASWHQEITVTRCDSAKAQGWLQHEAPEHGERHIHLAATDGKLCDRIHWNQNPLGTWRKTWEKPTSKKIHLGKLHMAKCLCGGE